MKAATMNQAPTDQTIPAAIMRVHKDGTYMRVVKQHVDDFMRKMKWFGTIHYHDCGDFIEAVEMMPDDDKPVAGDPMGNGILALMVNASNEDVNVFPFPADVSLSEIGVDAFSNRGGA